MKDKFLTSISVIMLFVPWTILPLRKFNWALQSPTAELIIACYLVFMIINGIFTILSFTKGNVKNNLIKICLVVNCLYAVAGVVILGMMINTQLI